MGPPGPAAAHAFLKFVNKTPTPFHFVLEASQKLDKAGFKLISEQDKWEDNLAEGGKYYFTRNQSSLIAFTVPKRWKQGTGVSIVATHIDSPNLRVRPVSKKSESGYMQVGVETYGGGIWHTWFDRDLSLAGRIVVAGKNKNDWESRLVNIARPLIRIPTLAIHLDRAVNEGFKFNAETEFVPIIGLLEAELNKEQKKVEENLRSQAPAESIELNHHPALLNLLAEELNVVSEDIRDFELHLYDTQPSTLFGINNEFISSPRLDNQFSSYCALEALIQSTTGDILATAEAQQEGNVNLIALFNHEEVGSVSSTGAESSLIPSVLNRLSPTPQTMAQSVNRSFLISCDMGHALHPSYKSRYEEHHRPKMNGGIVLKTNAKQRYTTDSVSAHKVKRLIAKRGGKVQEFEVRNDMACGSTVGPMLSKIGIRTVDIGIAQLSMHSIRETCGSHDVSPTIDLFVSFFEGFADMDRELLAH